MSILFVRLDSIVLLAMPEATALSTRMSPKSGVIWNSSVARFGCGSLTCGGRAPSQRVLYHSFFDTYIYTYIHTYIKCTYRRGAGLGRALAVAGVKALVTLSAMSIIGYTYIHT